MKKKAAWIPWLTGLCMSTALMAAIFLFGDLKYAMNDDTAILRQYMGFGTGVIPEAHAFLHPLLSTPLRWLGLAAPEVAWFSWMQLALLWLAGAVSVKALMQCFAHRGRSPWLGAAAGAVYLTLFGMTYACHVTFTVTAAVLGAAAVLQLCSIDGERYTDGQVFRALMLALALTALCGGLRLICVLPVALYCGLALVPLAARDFGFGRRKKRSWKPLLCGVCVVVLVLGALPLWRAAKMKAAGMEDYLNWQNANGRVVDYYGIKGLTDEELALALALTVNYAVPAAQALARQPKNPEILDPFATLDWMAAEDPDCLYFYDGSLCADSRMFPRTDLGVPKNLLFWGGWTFRSPEYMKCLSRFGVTEQELDTELFLRDDVYLARGMVVPESTELIDVLSEKAEEEIASMQGGEEGGVYLFQFY